jgi:CheY-like chemotaxis protein
MANIMIVDDSKLTRNVLQEILTSDGHEVIEATNGQEAIEMTATNTPDCIILDILMPEMDGFEVLKVLKNKALKIPVVINSADIQKTTRQKCFQLGAFSFTNKPPKKEELLKAVHEAVASIKGMNK